MYETHKWNSEFCSCGQDTVVCQKCGKPVCANVGYRKDEKNYCLRCATTYFGIGHMGTKIQAIKITK